MAQSRNKLTLLHNLIALSVLFVYNSHAFADGVTGSANDPQDFPTYLKQFLEYSKERAAVNETPSQATFSSSLKFRYEACPMQMSGIGGAITSGIPSTEIHPQMPTTEYISAYAKDGHYCNCPVNSKHLQCLVSGVTEVHTDPRDIAGTGYFAIIVSGNETMQFLSKSGKWKSITDFKDGEYSWVESPIQSQYQYNLPISSLNPIMAKCAPGKVYQMSLGYGAVTPKEIEYAKFMQQRSAAVGTQWNSEQYLWNLARLNGYKPMKAGVVANLTCGPAFLQ